MGPGPDSGGGNIVVPKIPTSNDCSPDRRLAEIGFLAWVGGEGGVATDLDTLLT